MNRIIVERMSSVMDRIVVEPWWRQQRWRRVGIAVAVVIGATIGLITFVGDADRVVRLQTDTLRIAAVELGEYHDFIPLRGKVVPRDVIYLDALEGGRVEKVLVEPGDYVEAGQPLVALSNTQLELDVLDREARLVESLTQLQTYQTQLEQNRLNNEKALALIDYDITRLSRAQQRRTQLAGRQVEAKEVLDKISDELDYVQKLRPLQASSNQEQDALRRQQQPQIAEQLEKLQRDVAITRSKLDNLTVKAPMAGRMTAIDLKIGETRNRGERFGELTPETGNKLSAQIDEFYLGQLRKDQIASVSVEGKQWTLRVTRILPQVRDGTFAVDLQFEGATPAGLLPGQTMQGKLSLGASTPGLLVPTGGFLERTGGDWIFVLDEDGKSARRRQIKVGRRNTEQVEVLSGLHAGERVIVSDYGGLERTDRIDLAGRAAATQ